MSLNLDDRDNEHFTEVEDLRTGKKYTYSLPPEDAVKAAYLQYYRDDWATWDYPIRTTPPLDDDKVSVSCGDFVALKKRKTECTE